MDRRQAGVEPGGRAEAGEGAGVPAGEGAGERAPLGDPTSDGRALLERLRAVPGGAELIAFASADRRSASGGIELVGGAVRDLMLGLRPRELDVVVRGEVEALARELAERLGGEATVHARFGTALVSAPRVDVDLARTRAESYPGPGALPQVRPGTPDEDLQRRDFTVNAIALALAGEDAGSVRAVPGALEDLRARRLRVLHDQSFQDDPTRIVRMVRYAVRLGFEVEPHTAELVAQALQAGALRTVSGQRRGAELRLAFAEPCAVEVLAELDRLGVLSAWEPGVSFDEHVVRVALEIMPEDGSRPVLFAAALLLALAGELDAEDTEAKMREFISDLQLPAGVGERVFGAAVSACFVIDSVDEAGTTPDLLELTDGTPIESLALAAAVRDLEDGPGSYGRALIEDWLRDQRHVALQVTGDDLIAAGVPEGPEVGLRLEESYRLLLEERIEPGRESELRAALEAQL
jgi:tRNA nucleotidyltransferase (CCA-adding enzyme)